MVIFFIVCIAYFLTNITFTSTTIPDWGKNEYGIWLILAIILFFGMFRYSKKR